MSVEPHSAASSAPRIDGPMAEAPDTVRYLLAWCGAGSDSSAKAAADGRSGQPAARSAAICRAATPSTRGAEWLPLRPSP
jgi:hypothetical protein